MITSSKLLSGQGPVGLEQCPYFALYLLLIYRVEQLVTSTIFHLLSTMQLHMLCAFDLINWDFFIGWFTFQNKKHMVSGKWLTYGTVDKACI